MKTRVFNWNGSELVLEDWVTHLARDKRGRWHQFDRVPTINSHRGMFVVERGSRQELLTKAGIPDPDWKSSLVEVDVILRPALEAAKRRKDAKAAENNRKAAEAPVPKPKPKPKAKKEAK